MPVAKLLGTSTPDAMKAEEGTDSLDTFIRQAVGKEPLFSFSRAGDGPVQWIQLLHALDHQQDVPGWPLLAPIKVQMQKCDKCAQEFCSSINYRRHIRVHRRSMNFHKEPQKYRDLLGAFWDKLSSDEAKEIMSFDDVNLEEVPGSTIIRNLTANLRIPIFLSLPQAYVKAGSVLVDVIEGRSSRLPISSQELFGILDDASERTFLCAGTAESLQKYVFDGEVRKISLEMRNLIACTSFLIEQKLVKAWVADKDAEALRCQKLLVEEEEAAQRRQAELLERKRQRKLRQKEQRARDQSDAVKVDLYAASDIVESTPSEETSIPQISAEVDPFIPDSIMPLEAIPFSNNEDGTDIEAQAGCGNIDHSHSATGQNTEEQRVQGDGLQDFVAQWQVPKSQKGGRHGSNALKQEQAHKHGEQRMDSVVNSSNVWSKKPNSENVGGELVKSRVHNDAVNHTEQRNCQLMIGSISVTLRNCRGHHQINSQTEDEENGDTELKNIIKHGTNRSTVKFWRPRHDTRGQLADRSSNQVLEDDAGADQPVNESHHQSCDLNGSSSKGTGAKTEEALFSIDAAKAFLTQRWKEATSGDHVQLLISSPPGPPGEPDTQNDRQASESQGGSVLGRPPGDPDTQNDHQASESQGGNALGRPPGDPDTQNDCQPSESQGGSALGKVEVLEESTQANVEAKFRTKPEKSVETKYIPKQSTIN